MEFLQAVHDENHSYDLLTGSAQLEWHRYFSVTALSEMERPQPQVFESARSG
jgi:hypothetical protein